MLARIRSEMFLGGIFLGVVLVGVSCAPQAPTPTPPNGLTQGPAKPEEKPKPSPIEVPTNLKPRLEAALQHIHSRDLLTTHGFWTVFHGILGTGLEKTTLLDEKTGQKVNAIDYICDGGELRGLRFIPTADGLDVQIGPSFVGQGHQDQFIAEMIQWGMPINKKVKVLGKDYAFRDFVNHSKMRCSTTSGQELSWAIIVVGEHYGTDHTWINSKGEKISFDDMLRYELAQPMDIAACGGTHRLFGLSWAYHLHRNRGGKKEGVWVDVAKRLQEHKDLAKKLRNPDGSLSTEYFKGAGNKNDIQVRISTTGHILEWLALGMTDEELKQPWVQEAASALCETILKSHNEPIEGGALYHATHGLQIYYTRLFGPPGAAGPLPAVPNDF